MEIDSIVIHADDDSDHPRRGVVTDIDWSADDEEIVRVYWFLGCSQWHVRDNLVHVA